MTAYQKIAISLPLQAAENVRRAVKQGRAASVSAYIAAAIDEKAKTENLATMLAEMLAETGGPLSPAERRAADRRLGGALPKRRVKRRR
jgi:Arc/MetJ-type ribon-helix-helix transcriptional regulator